MAKIVATQWLLLVVLAVIAYVVGGLSCAISLVLGGASYALPTLISILFLNILKSQPRFKGFAFFGSEGLKIILSLIFLTGSFFVYPIQFLPFFIGLLAVTHLFFLIFLKVHYYGSK